MIEAPVDSGRMETGFDEIRHAAIPANLTGKEVLDIGGYDGHFAALCLERGAERAVCVDTGEWRDYGWAPPVKRPGVQYVKGDVMTTLQQGDVVIFYNVIYHCRDPWTALERLRRLTRDQLLLCTSFVQGAGSDWRVISPDDPGQRIVNNRFTVFWKPTISGLVKLLKLTGFNDLHVVGYHNDHIVMDCR